MFDRESEACYLIFESDPIPLKNGGAMPKAPFPPLSVSKPALLFNRSDAEFRRLLYDLFGLIAILETLRREFSRKMAVAPSQYGIIRLIAERHRHGGITVTEITNILHLHNSFVVLQTGLLVKSGILKRIPNPRDKRSVLLHLSKKGEEAVVIMGPAVRLVNDYFFGWMGKKDFKRFSAVAAELVQRGPTALETLRSLMPESAGRPRNIKLATKHAYQMSVFNDDD